MSVNPVGVPQRDDLRSGSIADIVAPRVVDPPRPVQARWHLTSPFIFLGIILGLFSALYTSIVRLSARADAAWSDIDVQLKRRHDLIAKLVETVRVGGPEGGACERVATLRSAAMQATTPADRVAAEVQLTAALQDLMAAAESDPQLRASQKFAELRGSLHDVENALQSARRSYNAVVRDLNLRVQTAPMNLFASALRLEPRPVFDVPSADRDPVAVRV